MSTVSEIKAAIESLSPADFDELAAWIVAKGSYPPSEAITEQWLREAVGAAKEGVSTDTLMQLSRGES